METLYAILGMIAFAGFIIHQFATGIPHLPLLMFAMYFSILFKLEGKK